MSDEAFAFQFGQVHPQIHSLEMSAGDAAITGLKRKLKVLRRTLDLQKAEARARDAAQDASLGRGVAATVRVFPRR